MTSTTTKPRRETRRAFRPPSESDTAYRLAFARTIKKIARETFEDDTIFEGDHDHEIITTKEQLRKVLQAVFNAGRTAERQGR